MTSKPVLAIGGLRHGYGDAPIVDDFALTLAAGEHMLLLGPSGSGKTTLINLISGLLTPDAGTIEIVGEPMHGSPAVRDDLRRRHIGLIFQTLRLVSALSITDNLRLAQRLSGNAVNDLEIGQLLGEVGLSHRAHAKPRQLSQGEGQRAAVARALVTKPALLIADEPTSALDDANADRIAKLLLASADAHGSTLLIATHDARLKAHIPGAVLLAPRVVVA